MIVPNAFCTIITSNYVHYALALNESLLRYQADVPLYIFITDKDESVVHWQKDLPNIVFVYIEDLCEQGRGKAIFDKYAAEDMDAFRWSMKGVLMEYLITTKGVEKVIFVDCDIYFFNDYQFLWQELEQHRLLITPHWRAALRYQEDPQELSALFTEGLYNAGFIGANKTAIPILRQLALWCLFECKKDQSSGIYVDQTYLNLLPIYFEDVKILKHKGCNVAGWNKIECNRQLVEEEVLIEGIYPVVFIHFIRHGIWFIMNGSDGLLNPHLSAFLASLKKYKPDFDYYQHYRIFRLDGTFRAKREKQIAERRKRILLQQKDEKNERQRVSQQKKVVSRRNRMIETIYFKASKMGIRLPKSVKNILKKIVPR